MSNLKKESDIKVRDIAVIETGILKREKVLAVGISREDFLKVVDAEIDGREDVKEIIRPIAEKMSRFPLDTWVDEDRGCGCLVGEALIAFPNFDRESVAKLANGIETVENLLLKNVEPNMAETLINFGTEIDYRVSELIHQTDLSEIREEVEEDIPYIDVVAIIVD